MSTLTAEQLGIIERLCAANLKGPKQQALLIYLCENSALNNDEALSQIGIARNVYRHPNPEKWVKDEEAGVRAAIGDLRRHIDKYFDAHQEEPLRIAILKGGLYAVQWVPNGEIHCRDFWRHFIGPAGRPVYVVYTEPRFFHQLGERRNRDVFIRQLDKNQPEHGSPNGFEDARPCYNYVAAGEVRAMVQINNWLQERKGNVQVQVSRAIALQDNDQFNLILLGSSRTNTLVSDLVPLSTDFSVTQYSIQLANHSREHEEEAEYEDLSVKKKHPTYSAAYVLVIRTPSLVPHQSLIVISSHHARAYELVANALTTESVMRDICTMIGGDSFPERIDILFEVLVDKEGNPRGVKPLTWRPRTFESGGTPSE